MDFLYVRLALIFALASSCFYAGWWTKGNADAAKEAAAKEAQQKVLDAFHKQETNVASILEKKLAELRANEKVTEHETLKIIDRPIYHIECLDADGLQLLEQARLGNNKATKPSGPVRGASKPN